MKKSVYNKCNNLKDNPRCGGIKLEQSDECRSCSKYKGIKHLCLECGKEFLHRSDTKNIFCSYQCYLDNGYHEGENNPQFGKSLTIDILNKRRRTMDQWSPEKKAEYKKNASDRLIKNNKNPTKRLKQSEIISSKISTGKFHPFNNHKNGSYVKSDNSIEKYDSLYELARMIQLDELKLDWTKNHGIRIPYFYNGSNHKYTPDFLVDNKFLEEVKPNTLINLDINKIKCEQALIYCNNNHLIYRYITEDDINNYLDKAKVYHGRQISL